MARCWRKTLAHGNRRGRGPMRGLIRGGNRGARPRGSSPPRCSGGFPLADTPAARHLPALASVTDGAAGRAGSGPAARDGTRGRFRYGLAAARRVSLPVPRAACRRRSGARQKAAVPRARGRGAGGCCLDHGRNQCRAPGGTRDVMDGDDRGHPPGALEGDRTRSAAVKRDQEAVAADGEGPGSARQ